MSRGVSSLKYVSWWKSPNPTPRVIKALPPPCAHSSSPTKSLPAFLFPDSCSFVPNLQPSQIPMDVTGQLLNFSLFAILLCFLSKLLLPAPSIHRLLQNLRKCDGETSIRNPAPNFRSNSSRAESLPQEFRDDEDCASPRQGPVINADPSARASQEIRFVGLLEKYMDEKGGEHRENSRAERAISGAVENNLNQKQEESDSKYKEDDWEGIERTELETYFAAAVVYVGSSRNVGNLRSNVKKKLYGLHKIATQGPCCHPQPKPYKLSARAKCLGRAREDEPGGGHGQLHRPSVCKHSWLEASSAFPVKLERLS